VKVMKSNRTQVQVQGEAIRRMRLSQWVTVVSAGMVRHRVPAIHPDITRYKERIKKMTTAETQYEDLEMSHLRCVM
jgi:hypothetical protein